MKPLELLVIDTLPPARAYADVIELSPIKSGATVRYILDIRCIARDD